MLKEGWDVRNVTTIVGLRAYAAKSNILPEQTLGRGLRRMYFGTDTRETVSVMGTPAFMDFVESIQIHHTIQLDGSGSGDYRSVVGFFARQLMKDLRLVTGYEVLYPRVRDFLSDHLFESGAVDLADAVVLRNLSEPEVGKILFDSFKKAINALTIQESGSARIEDWIRLKETRPFRTEPRDFLVSKKSVFNRIVGETHAGALELAFAAFLESAIDVLSYAKNYLAIGFKLDYVKANGDLSTYTPDFILKTSDGVVWIVETKGREELDLPQKMSRLAQWCADASAAQNDRQRYDFVYVDQASFEKHAPQTFSSLSESFIEFKQAT